MIVCTGHGTFKIVKYNRLGYTAKILGRVTDHVSDVIFLLTFNRFDIGVMAITQSSDEYFNLL